MPSIVRTTARLLLAHPSRSVALWMTAAMMLTSSPSAQLGAKSPPLVAPFDWSTQPLVTPGGSSDSHVTIKSAGGSILVIQTNFNADIEITRVDSHGYPKPTFIYNASVDAAVPIVGCSLGSNRFALGYKKGGLLYVAFLRRIGNSYYVESGFPKTIGQGYGLRMVPRLTRNADIADPLTAQGEPIRVDGVLLGWWRIDGSGPQAGVSIRQQGIRSNGNLIWDGGYASDGAPVGDTQLDIVNPFGITLVSDSFGLAITTYRKVVPAGDGYWTTRLDSTGTPTTDAAVDNEPVPMGFTREPAGPCFVARDGFGGAYYSYAKDLKNGNDDQTSLMVSTVPLLDVSWPMSLVSTNLTPKLRPLAILPAPDNTFVLAYRDEVAAVALRLDGGFLPLWTDRLAWATSNNSEELSATLNSCGVAFAWTRFNDGCVWTELLFEQKNISNGGTNPTADERKVYCPTNVPMTCLYAPDVDKGVRRPQILSRQGGAVITWFNDADSTIHAEALNCDGSFSN